MWQSEAVRIAAEEGGEQWRQGRSSPGPSTPQSSSQKPSAAGRFFFKLNRQIPELETALSLRKQRSANCSNRQKSYSLVTGYSLAPLALTQEGTKQGPLVTRHSPLVTGSSNRELLGLENLQLAENKHWQTVLIENFEPNHRAGFRAFVAAAFGRAAFLFQSSGHPGESAQREGRSK
jgi:hypothetical protein